MNFKGEGNIVFRHSLRQRHLRNRQYKLGRVLFVLGHYMLDCIGNVTITRNADNLAKLQTSQCIRIVDCGFYQESALWGIATEIWIILWRKVDRVEDHLAFIVLSNRLVELPVDRMFPVISCCFRPANAAIQGIELGHIQISITQAVILNIGPIFTRIFIGNIVVNIRYAHSSIICRTLKANQESFVIEAYIKACGIKHRSVDSKSRITLFRGIKGNRAIFAYALFEITLKLNARNFETSFNSGTHNKGQRIVYFRQGGIMGSISITIIGCHHGMCNRIAFTQHLFQNHGSGESSQILIVYGSPVREVESVRSCTIVRIPGAIGSHIVICIYNGAVQETFVQHIGARHRAVIDRRPAAKCRTCRRVDLGEIAGFDRNIALGIIPAIAKEQDRVIRNFCRKFQIEIDGVVDGGIIGSNPQISARSIIRRDLLLCQGQCSLHIVQIHRIGCSQITNRPMDSHIRNHLL